MAKCLLFWTLLLSLTVAAVCQSTCLSQGRCQSPGCRCSDAGTPGDLAEDVVPQMVVFTFDSSVNTLVYKFYDRLFSPERRNPNGCPIKMTLFVPHLNTNYKMVKSLADRGMEIGAQGVSPSAPRTYWRDITHEGMFKEINEQLANLENEAGIPRSEIYGWRNPGLQPSGDLQFNLLQNFTFLYDSSLSIAKRGFRDKNIWPYTLDYGWGRQCHVRPCPRGQYQGIWEVPVVSLVDPERKGPCGGSHLDSCIPRCKQAAVNLLWKNFLSHYQHDKAPFLLNMQALWFLRDPNLLDAVDEFMQILLTYDDVYFVTAHQALQWIASPVPKNRVSTFKPWQCTSMTPRNASLLRYIAPAIIEPPCEGIVEPIIRTMDLPKCVQTRNCIEPSCRCSKTGPPVSVPLPEIPQMIIVTYDGTVTSTTSTFYRQLFDGQRKNPNGCPISMTMFIHDLETNYDLVQDWYLRGMEIGVHSVSVRSPSSYWATLSKKQMFNEIVGQREQISSNTRIPESQIRGWRSPFLQPSGDRQFSVLYENNFDYDSTLTITKRTMDFINRWPFSMDYGWDLNCEIPPCPVMNYTGLWQVPIVSLVNATASKPCQGPYVDSCITNGKQEAYDLLISNFNSHYKKSRAPFMINLQVSWLMVKHNLEAMKDFFDTVLVNDDVYILSINHALRWMKNPTYLSAIPSFSPWQCSSEPPLLTTTTTTTTTTTSRPTTKRRNTTRRPTAIFRTTTRRPTTTFRPTKRTPTTTFRTRRPTTTSRTTTRRPTTSVRPTKRRPTTTLRTTFRPTTTFRTTTRRPTTSVRITSRRPTTTFRTTLRPTTNFRTTSRRPTTTFRTTVNRPTTTFRRTTRRPTNIFIPTAQRATTTLRPTVRITTTFVTATTPRTTPQMPTTIVIAATPRPTVLFRPKTNRPTTSYTPLTRRPLTFFTNIAPSTTSKRISVTTQRSTTEYRRPPYSQQTTTNASPTAFTSPPIFSFIVNTLKTSKALYKTGYTTRISGKTSTPHFRLFYRGTTPLPSSTSNIPPSEKSSTESVRMVYRPDAVSTGGNYPVTYSTKWRVTMEAASLVSELPNVTTEYVPFTIYSRNGVSQEGNMQTTSLPNLPAAKNTQAPSPQYQETFRTVTQERTGPVRGPNRSTIEENKSEYSGQNSQSTTAAYGHHTGYNKTKVNGNYKDIQVSQQHHSTNLTNNDDKSGKHIGSYPNLRNQNYQKNSSVSLVTPDEEHSYNKSLITSQSGYVGGNNLSQPVGGNSKSHAVGGSSQSQPVGGNPSQPVGGNNPSQPVGDNNPPQPDGGNTQSQPVESNNPTTPSTENNPSQPLGENNLKQPIRKNNPPQYEGENNPVYFEKENNLTQHVGAISPSPLRDNKTTQPVQYNNPTQPVGDNKPTRPMGDNITIQPVGGNKQTQRVRYNNPRQPDGGSNPSQPVVDNNPTQPARGNKPTQPVGDNTTTQPVGGNPPIQLIGDNKRTQSVGGNKTTQPVGGNDSKQSVGVNNPKQSVQGNKAIQPVEGNSPSQPSRENNPAQPVVEHTPSQYKGENNPTKPVGSNNPSKPVGKKNTSQPVGSNYPIQSVSGNNPTQPVGGKRLSQSVGRNNPVQTLGKNNPTQLQSVGENSPSKLAGENNTSHATGEKNPSHATGENNPSHATEENNPSQPVGENNHSQHAGSAVGKDSSKLFEKNKSQRAGENGPLQNNSTQSNGEYTQSKVLKVNSPSRTQEIRVLNGNENATDSPEKQTSDSPILLEQPTIQVEASRSRAIPVTPQVNSILLLVLTIFLMFVEL